jgi:hypothetical protein
MSNRFSPGATAYAKDGKGYIVEEVVRGVVYCHSEAGDEAEFPESQLMTDSEKSGQTGGQSTMLYARLRQSTVYAPYKGPIAAKEAEHLLARAAMLFPGILDFAAFDAARRAFAKSSPGQTPPDLSIVKCRELFDAVTPQTRVTLLAGLAGAAPEMLVSAGRVGDNLVRAMIEKGLNASAFEAFGSRRRQ